MLRDWKDKLGMLCLSFPGGSDGKASVYNVGDPGSIPGSGSSLEKEMATHSSMDGGAWCPWDRKESDTTEQLHFTSYMLKSTYRRKVKH